MGIDRGRSQVGREAPQDRQVSYPTVSTRTILRREKKRKRRCPFIARTNRECSRQYHTSGDVKGRPLASRNEGGRARGDWKVGKKGRSPIKVGKVSK